MYLRSREDALDAVAEILNLPERCDQLVQATVKIMLCLEVEPRLFLADCQALLVEGGLEALRRKRHDLLESLENCPLVVLDPVEDRLFDQRDRFDAVAAEEGVRPSTERSSPVDGPRRDRVSDAAPPRIG